jgi:uncharacterized protein (DUF2236 family)
MGAGGITAAGLFGPGSAVWRVDREVAVLLGSGPRALLLQVAHPMVAAAVSEHSRYAVDPLGRLRHTLEAIYAFGFADVPQAMAHVQAVNRLHARVQGTLPVAVGAHAADTPYRALDPSLMLWVYATLIDSALIAYERLVGSLTEPEREAYYSEMRHAGPVWGIPPELFPLDLRALREWMVERVACGEVAVGDQGRAIARQILRTPAWWIPAPAFVPIALTAVWLLPPTIRQQFGLSWGPRREALMERMAALSRSVVPRLPRSVRDVPCARAAERRVSRTTPQPDRGRGIGSESESPGIRTPHGACSPGTERN